MGKLKIIIRSILFSALALVGTFAFTKNVSAATVNTVTSTKGSATYVDYFTYTFDYEINNEAVITANANNYAIIKNIDYSGARALTINTVSIKYNGKTYVLAVKQIGDGVNPIFSDMTESNASTLTISSAYLDVINENAFKGMGYKTVTISSTNNVTIEKNAFTNMAQLTTVSLGNGNYTINSNAFTNNSLLKTVTFGKGNYNIKSGAFDKNTITTATINCLSVNEDIDTFRNSTTLTKLTLANITEIPVHMFEGCTGLTAITIPASVTKIGDGAFKDCSNATTLSFAGTSCKTIRNSAFEGCPLTKIGGTANAATIPNSVSYIGEKAFYGLQVATLNVGTDATYIGSYAFSDNLKLTTLAVNSTTDITIKDKSFYNCPLLKTLTLGKGNYDIENGAIELNQIKTATINCLSVNEDINIFRNNINLTKLTLANITEIPAHMFEGCTGLTAITIPVSVKKIGVAAFKDCSAASSLTFTATSTCSSIGASAFEGTKVTLATIPDSVVNIGDRAFYGCKATALTLGKGVAYIGNEAFAENVNAKSVTINSTGNCEIKENAFENCSLVASLAINSTGNVTIRNDAFANCPLLKTLTLGKGNYDIENGAFDENQLTKATLNCISYNDGISLFRNATNLTTLTLANVTSIPAYMFEGCTGLTAVTIPAGTLEIGEGAFKDCINVAAVTFSSTVLKTIGDSAFEGCSLLRTGGSGTAATIPNSVTYIGDRAFYGSNFVTLNIGTATEYIGEYAFANNPKMTTLAINSTANITIKENAFIDCPLLKTLTLGKGNYNIENGAFDENQITKAVINCISINENIDLFRNATNLTSLTLANITSIPSHMFEGCTGLTAITIPASVKEIGDYAFFECSALKGISYSNGTKDITIGEYAFSECENLVNISVPNAIKEIENFAFANNSPMTVNFASLEVFNRVGDIDKIFYNTDLTIKIGGVTVTFANKLEGNLAPKQDSVVPDQSVMHSSVAASKQYILLPNEVYIDGVSYAFESAIFNFELHEAKAYDASCVVTSNSYKDTLQSSWIKGNPVTPTKINAKTAVTHTPGLYGFQYQMVWQNGAIGYLFSSAQLNTVNITYKEKETTFTLNYDANGGLNAPMPDVYVVTGANESHTFTVTSDHPTKEGYSFEGWYTEPVGGEKMEAGSKITMKDDLAYSESGISIFYNISRSKEITLYAHWSERNMAYTLHYDTNGGTSNIPIPDEEHLYGENVTITGTEPQLEGYKFAGWTKNKHELGEGLSNGEHAYQPKEISTKTSYSILDANDTTTTEVTLYAYWEKYNPFDYFYDFYYMDIDGLLFKIDENVSNKPVRQEDGKELPIPNTDITDRVEANSKDGFTFIGAKAYDGEQAVSLAKPNAFDNEFVASEGEHIIFFYERNKYTLTLTGDDGIESTSGSGTYLYGQTAQIDANVKGGHSFAGWTGDYTKSEKSTSVVIIKNTEMKANTGSLIRYDAKEVKNHYTAIAVDMSEIAQTIRFNGSGAKGSMPDQTIRQDDKLNKNAFTYGFTETKDGITVTKTGTFMGWVLDPGKKFTIIYEDEEPYYVMSTDDVVDLYAVWRVITEKTDSSTGEVISIEFSTVCNK